MEQVFISYSRLDEEAAIYIEELLDTSSGVTAWRDKTAMPGGSLWKDEITRQIAASKLLILLWSANAKASVNVDTEVRTALAHSITILPVMLTLDEPLPDYVRQYNYLVQSDENFDVRLKSDLLSIVYPTPSLSPVTRFSSGSVALQDTTPLPVTPEKPAGDRFPNWLKTISVLILLGILTVLLIPDYSDVVRNSLSKLLSMEQVDTTSLNPKNVLVSSAQVILTTVPPAVSQINLLTPKDTSLSPGGSIKVNKGTLVTLSISDSCYQNVQDSFIAQTDTTIQYQLKPKHVYLTLKARLISGLPEINNVSASIKNTATGQIYNKKTEQRISLPPGQYEVTLSKVLSVNGQPDEQRSSPQTINLMPCEASKVEEIKMPY